MDQLRKFLEISAGTAQTGRVAYAFDALALPEPSVGLKWQPVKDFCAANELLIEPRLEEVFQGAVKQGYVLTRPAF
jgi:hypothetical protein